MIDMDKLLEQKRAEREANGSMLRIIDTGNTVAFSSRTSATAIQHILTLDAQGRAWEWVS